MNKPTTRAYTLSMKGSSSVVCFDKEEVVLHLATLDESESGDEYKIIVRDFTDAELESMPEFDGF